MTTSQPNVGCTCCTRIVRYKIKRLTNDRLFLLTYTAVFKGIFKASKYAVLFRFFFLQKMALAGALTPQGTWGPTPYIGPHWCPGAYC